MSQHTGSFPDTLERPDAWVTQAICAGPEFADNRDLWFAQKKDKAAVRRARQICWDCPVLEQCGQWALDNHERFGMWGAVDETARRAMLRWRGIRIDDEPEPSKPAPARKKRQPATCGTPGGYKKHRREKTTPCRACRAANTAYHLERRHTGFSKALAS